MCFCMIGAEGLGAIAFCDKEYPARVAVQMLKDLLAEFKTEQGCVLGVGVGSRLLPAHTHLPNYPPQREMAHRA